MTSVRRIFASPRARALAAQQNIPLPEVAGSGPSGRIIEQDVQVYRSQRANMSSGPAERDPSIRPDKKIQATPLARAIAQLENIDLSTVAGSGVSGKIRSSDVRPRKEESASAGFSAERVPPMEAVPMTGMRKIIAERMAYSKQTAPHVTLTVKAEVTRLAELRNKWMQDGMKVSYTDLLVKIAAESLRAHPRVNVSMEQDGIVRHRQCDIGVAVALEEGLIVPVIRDADRRRLQDISKDLQDKVKRSKEGKLRRDEVQGGRFTISNLGMYEVDAFTPIINLPESAILGVGRMIEDLIVHNGQIHIGKTMVLSLSFDHRVMDGAPAALFLKNIKELLENPESLQDSL